MNLTRDSQYLSRVVWEERPSVAGQCPVSHALEVVVGKWTTLIVRDLLGGTKRFTELRAGLDGVNPKVLTERLRLLEEHGIVERRAYAEIPPRVEYSLTERGRSLEPVLAALWHWGASDLRSEDSAQRMST